LSVSRSLERGQAVQAGGGAAEMHYHGLVRFAGDTHGAGDAKQGEGFFLQVARRDVVAEQRAVNGDGHGHRFGLTSRQAERLQALVEYDRESPVSVSLGGLNLAGLS